MGKYKVELIKSGVRDLLCSEDVARECRKYADAAAARAGEGYESGARNYPERHGAGVYPATPEAYFDNLHNNTLMKAVRSS